jgi:hypothetical protein
MIRDETAFASVYYVDSRSGEDRNDGLTPQKAWKSLDRVNETLFRPGDRILFRSGTRYAGQLKPQGSGDAPNGLPRPIVIDRYGEGPPPILDGEGKVGATLYLYNVEYWEVRGLEIVNLGPKPQPRRTGVYLHLQDFGVARHMALKGLRIRDVNGSNVKREGGGAGILWNVEGQEIPSRFDGLLIEGCRLERCDRNGIEGGGYWRRSEWFPSLRVVIRGNRLEDIGGDGIVPIACDGALVERNVLRGAGMRAKDGEAIAGIWPWSCDNTVVQHNEATGVRGPWDAQGFDSDWNSRNTLIQYNYSHDNEGGFLLICDDGGQLEADSVGNVGTVVRYNLSVNDGFRAAGKHAGFSPAVHITGPVRGARVYNNTIVFGKKPEGADLHLFRFTDWNGWPQGAEFVNNVFTVEDEAGYDYGQARNLVFDRNLYGGPQKNAPEDPHALREDPGFRGPLPGAGPDALRSYRLKDGSPAIGAGRTIPDNGGRDVLGALVPADRPPSLGALEAAPRDRFEERSGRTVR